MALMTILMALGGLVGFVGWLWLLVVAFRVSAGWGLLLLLLGWTWIPIIIFALLNWNTAKRPVIVAVAGVAISLTGLAVGVFALGVELGSIADKGLDAASESAQSDDEAASDHASVLPPPRPTAQATHPSWEAIVSEVESEDNGSWERFVPTPTPITGRGAGWLEWRELEAHVGHKVVVELDNNTIVTATLEAVEPTRILVRHVIGGGEASYWIDRDQVELIRPAG